MYHSLGCLAIKLTCPWSQVLERLLVSWHWSNHHWHCKLKQRRTRNNRDKQQAAQAQIGPWVGTNVITKEDFNYVVPKRQRQTKLRSSSLKLTAFGGHDIPVIGKCTLKCLVNGTSQILKFQVVEKGNSLLRCEDCKKLKLVTFNVNEIHKISKGQFDRTNEGRHLQEILCGTNLRTLSHQDQQRCRACNPFTKKSSCSCRW